MAAKFLGNTDEVSTCDCCGRQNLKSTVALSIDDGEAVYYGVTCAARALSVDAKFVRSESRKADDDRKAREFAAAAAERDAADTRFGAFLLAVTGHSDRWLQLQAMGGMQAARAKFAGVAA